MGRRKIISDEQLLEVARRVFTAEGMAASTKAVAREAGISEGVIFQRFKTKEELFFAAMIPPPADLKRIFQHPRVKGRALIEKVVFAMLEYFRVTLPVLLPLVSHPAFQFEEFAARQPQSAMVALRRELMQFLNEEKSAGRMGAIDPGAASLLIWSTAQSVAFFELMGAHGGRLPDEVIRRAVGALWVGLRPDKNGSPKLKA